MFLLTLSSLPMGCMAPLLGTISTGGNLVEGYSEYGAPKIGTKLSDPVDSYFQPAVHAVMDDRLVVEVNAEDHCKRTDVRLGFYASDFEGIDGLTGNQFADTGLYLFVDAVLWGAWYGYRYYGASGRDEILIPFTGSDPERQWEGDLKEEDRAQFIEMAKIAGMVNGGVLGLQLITKAPPLPIPYRAYSTENCGRLPAVGLDGVGARQGPQGERALVIQPYPEAGDHTYSISADQLGEVLLQAGPEGGYSDLQLEVSAFREDSDDLPAGETQGGLMPLPEAEINEIVKTWRCAGLSRDGMVELVANTWTSTQSDAFMSQHAKTCQEQVDAVQEAFCARGEGIIELATSSKLAEGRQADLGGWLEVATLYLSRCDQKESWRKVADLQVQDYLAAVEDRGFGEDDLGYGEDLLDKWMKLLDGEDESWKNPHLIAFTDAILKNVSTPDYDDEPLSFDGIHLTLTLVSKRESLYNAYWKTGKVNQMTQIANRNIQLLIQDAMASARQADDAEYNFDEARDGIELLKPLLGDTWAAGQLAYVNGQFPFYEQTYNAQIARMEAVDDCIDSRCQDVFSCSQEMDFDYWGNIVAITDRCRYLMACAGIADEYAALQCMQRQHDQCIRGCGGTP